MEVVKLLREHWLLAGTLICIFWPALLIFSPVYVPPVLLYILYVRYNQWKVDPGQSSQVSAGKGEPVDCTTTEKHVIPPASEAWSPTEHASVPACEHVEEDGSAKVVVKVVEKQKSSNKDNHPDQEKAGKSSQTDIDHQKRSLFSPTQAKLSTQGNADESGQAKNSGNLAAQDADGPTSESSATKAAVGESTGNPALGKPKSQLLTISVNADPPKKPAVVSPRKTPLNSPKKSADHIAKKLEVATAKKPAEKPVDGSAVAKGTEAPGKAAAQPLKKQSLDAPKALGTPKEPSAVAGREAEKSHAAATKTSSGETEAVHVRPMSGKQEQSPALDTIARPMPEATTESAPSSSEPVPSVGVSPREAKGSNGQDGNEHRSDHHKSKSKKKKKSHASK